MDPESVLTWTLTLPEVQQAMPGHYSMKTEWPDDVPWPEFTLTVRRWGVVEHSDVPRDTYSANPFQPQQMVSALDTGRIESLCRIVDIWQEHRPAGPHYPGGRDEPEQTRWKAGADGSGYNGKAEHSYDDMLRWGIANTGMKPFFWLDKIEWARDGDRRRGRVRSGRHVDERVARVDGSHYVLGSDITKLTDDELRRRSREAPHRGMGGRRLAFRFDDGSFVESDDVWYQGVIPLEFRHLLPDNAIMGDAARQDPAEVATRIPS